MIMSTVMCFCHWQTGAIAKTEKNKQVLDKLQVERERGITVKAQTASLLYSHQGQQYLLNLIDTPVSPQLGGRLVRRGWEKCLMAGVFDNLIWIWKSASYGSGVGRFIYLLYTSPNFPAFYKGNPKQTVEFRPNCTDYVAYQWVIRLL